MFKKKTNKNLKKRPFHKILITVGVFVIGLLFVLVSLFSYIFVVGSNTDKTSKEYVDTVVPKLSKTWNPKEMKKYASSEFMEQSNEAELQKFFTFCHEKLGKLKKYHTSEGESRVFLNNFKFNITALYHTQVEFEKADATIDVSLIRKNNTWYILGYKVNSVIFKPY